MKYSGIAPEGTLLHTGENQSYISSLTGLERAMRENKILEARAVMCDEDMNLHIDLNGICGIIPKAECLLTSANEEIKDIAIITRVGKPVCFKVTAIEPRAGGFCAILSRRAAQIECRSYYISSLKVGDIIPATVTHPDTFGAFVDIGCGICSLLCIDCISVSRISHPSDRLLPGDRIHVAVKTIDAESGRIFVTLKELRGTWEQNASEFCVGRTVTGIVRSIESYGVFVELSPNLAGLAELRDDSTRRCIEVGNTVSVYIKSILPDRMKIKLVLIDVDTAQKQKKPLRYYVDPAKVDHIERWDYSPVGCAKQICTIFE